MDCGISKHGARRAYKRGGVPKSRQAETIKRVLKYGLDPVELEDEFKNYILAKKRRHKEKGAYTYKIYGNMIYIFGYKNILVTVLNTPKEFIADAERRLGDKRRRIEATEAKSNERVKTEGQVKPNEPVKPDEQVKAEATTMLVSSDDLGVIDIGSNESIDKYEGYKLDNKTLLIFSDYTNCEMVSSICNEAVDKGLNAIAPEMDYNVDEISSQANRKRILLDIPNYLGMSDGLLIINKENKKLSLNTLLTIYEAWKLDKQVFLLYRMCKSQCYISELVEMVSVSLDGSYKRLFEY